MEVDQLLIWDSDLSPSVDVNKTIILWRSYYDGDQENLISIPSYIERHSDILKNTFLSWLFVLGETHINGHRLIDHLELRKGLSYWWMTSLMGKNYAQSERFYDAFRFFALENLIKSLKKQPDKIILFSSDPLATKVMRVFCHNCGIDFQCSRDKKLPVQWSVLSKIYSILPNIVQSCIYFFQYIFKTCANLFRLFRHAILRACVTSGIILQQQKQKQS